MGLLDSTLNIGADAIAAACGWLGLATADPGATGANPSAAPRIAANWPAASGGDVIATNRAFTGGAGNGPITHVTLWSAQTGGTYRGSYALANGSDTTFNAAGEYVVDEISIAGSSIG